jgi:exodeoxyribonuclease VII large subunit
MMIELNVPFMEKDEAKRLGARWNSGSKRWYIPPGTNVAAFMRWLPEDFVVSEAVLETITVNNKDRVEYSLSAFLFKVADLIQKNFNNAAWISAEISELRSNKGHLFITLVEHDELGNMVARTSARIWQTSVDMINSKFKHGTGSELEAGIKVLVFARVEFHPQYGMSLFIDDIDPTYTLGDMAAKLAKIREALTAEKIINNNKLLPKPVDFVRVAVISPQNAAGLGDFNREANILIKHNLCEFKYFTATFQGESAPVDICKAIALAIDQHAQHQFDALVIIRGGGALSDLAWLNNEQLARAICVCPIHVMAGIGHERDYTIIDEVAGERFDTPSKVIQRIFNLITGNAAEAEANYLEISRKVRHYYKYTRHTIDKLQQEVAQYAKQALVLAQRNINESYKISSLTALNLLQRVEEKINIAYQQVGEQVGQLCNNIEKQMQMLISEILSQSPKRILEKGFALVSNISGKHITSKQTASQESILTIAFHDGNLTVRTTE